MHLLLPLYQQSLHASEAPAADAQPPTRLLHDADTAMVLGHHLLDFWTNICVCHSLIVHENPQGGLPLYQVPSDLWALHVTRNGRMQQ